MSRSSASVITFILCLALGGALGLYLGVVVSPVTYTDTEFNALNQPYQDDYILMTATIYAHDKDLPAAEKRLVQLGLTTKPGPAIAAAAERLIAAQQPETDLRAVVLLAVTFGEITPAMQPYLP